MPITNQGKNVNMDKIHACKDKYALFKNVMNGVISPNSMRSRFLAYEKSCLEQIPTIGGRKKSRRNRKHSRKTTRRHRL